MKTTCKSKGALRGIMLVDILVYIGVLSILLVLAILTFNRFEGQSRRLRGVTDDIARAVDAGERWRADIRAASGPVHYDAEKGELLIPQKAGPVIYRLIEDRLERNSSGLFVPLLKNVHASSMTKSPRKHVIAWRWQVELKTRGKNAKLQPLFQFEAVAPTQS